MQLHRHVPALLACSFNRLLAYQTERLRDSLRPFAGKTVGFALDQPKLALTFSINAAGGVEALTLEESSVPPLPDVLIQLNGGIPRPPFSLESLLARAHIAGNAEMAEAISFLLRHLQINPGDILQPVLGDLLTHRVETGLRCLVGKLRNTVSTTCSR